MRRTRFGTLLLAAGWACFPLAIVFHTLAPALLGVALVSVVLAVRRPVVTLRIEREAPARVVAGEPFTLTTRATDEAGAPLWLDEEVPPGIRVISSRREVHRGRGEVVLEAVAADPGIVLWSAVRVRYQDAWGVLEDELNVSVVAATEVLPESSLIVQGRHAGRRVPIGARVKSQKGLDSEPEIERIREYRPGDRFRDIHWAHVAKLGKLVTRELRRENILPVVILLQASRSMRWQRRDSKFATCTRAALATVAAANANGLGTGLVAWSERGLEAQVRVAGGQRAISEAVLRLGRLPPPLPATEVAPPTPGAGHRPLSQEERKFLAAADAFAAHGGTGGATPVEAALAGLARVASQPSLVIAMLDAEETPDLVPIILTRLKQHGHRAVLVVPASGAHHYARDEVDDLVLDQLFVWRRNRETAAAGAARRGVPFLALGPDITEATIREVIKSAGQ